MLRHVLTDMPRMQRASAVLLATAFLVGNFLALLLIVFIRTFPWENQTSANNGSGGYLLLLNITFFIAVFIWISVIVNYRSLAAWGLVAHIAVTAVVLGMALDESAHSDGKVIMFGLLIEAFGAAAVISGARVVQEDVTAVDLAADAYSERIEVGEATPSTRSARTNRDLADEAENQDLGI